MMMALAQASKTVPPGQIAGVTKLIDETRSCRQ